MKVNRHLKNPIITPKDIIPSSKEMNVLGVFNCGVIEYKNEVLLLMRVAENVISKKSEVGVPYFSLDTNKIEIRYFNKNDKLIDFSDVRFVKTDEHLYLTSISHLRLARSKDGVNFKIDEKPFMVASNINEEFGIEDPRITKIGNKFYINYSSISSSGVTTSLAITKDFIKVERKGVIFLADNKDVAIFPKKIKGKYYALNRPVSAYFQKPEIWISESKDLLSYKNHEMIASLRKDNFDSARIGASCVPFLTKDGWIELYHGADENHKYCVGALLLDKDNPRKVLKRSNKAIVEPEAIYEKEGFMPNVIFPCGHLIKGNTVHMYYGSCDETICLLTFELDDLMESFKE